MIWGKLAASFYLFKFKKKNLQVHKAHEFRAELIKTNREMENTKTKGKGEKKNQQQLKAAAENIFCFLIISGYSPFQPALS